MRSSRNCSWYHPDGGALTYNVEPVSRYLLDDTLRDYVCSICWGPLDFHYDTETKQWYALCRSHKEETTGYTSRNFAERRRKESEHELIEAAYNLREIMGRAQKRTVEENLKGLCF